MKGKEGGSEVTGTRENIKKNKVEELKRENGVKMRREYEVRKEKFGEERKRGGKE